MVKIIIFMTIDCFCDLDHQIAFLAYCPVILAILYCVPYNVFLKIEIK